MFQSIGSQYWNRKNSLLLQSLDVATSQVAILEEYKNQYDTLVTELATAKSKFDETSSQLTAATVWYDTAYWLTATDSN